jgi:hypothetical protein
MKRWDEERRWRDAEEEDKEKDYRRQAKKHISEYQTH